MKKILLGCFILLGIASPAWAWTETYSWIATAGATSYKIEKSVDSGATWTLVSSPTTPTYTYVGAEPALVVFRISACNAVGCTIRAGDGFWHNEAWVPPAAPVNLQVQ